MCGLETSRAGSEILTRWSSKKYVIVDEIHANLAEKTLNLKVDTLADDRRQIMTTGSLKSL